jgi:mannose-6-phosphate isomerase
VSHAQILALHGKIQNYAWGSPTAIYDLLGLPPTGLPAAELWLGTHPLAPSEVSNPAGSPEAGPSPEPVRTLASDVVGELPFLLKVLAADKALSLQVHPDLPQARAGFAAEDAAGVPRDAPHRRYRDPNHKPELIVALTPFRALAGVRDPKTTLAVVRGLGCPGLVEAFAPLARDRRAGAAGVLRHLLTMPAAEGRALAAGVVAAATAVPSDAAPDLVRAADLIRLLAAAHPGDVGIAAALLLTDVTLRPGQALFQPARLLHAYVHGVGIEIMATSDNVLRGGLTPKHVDVDELLAVLDPTPTDAPVLDPRVTAEPGGTVHTWDVPVDDFTLSEAVCHGAVTVGGVGAVAVLLAVEGDVEVSALETPAQTAALALPLRRGQAALVVDAGPVTLTGTGRVFLASHHKTT